MIIFILWSDLKCFDFCLDNWCNALGVIILIWKNIIIISFEIEIWLFLNTVEYADNFKRMSMDNITA